MVLIIDLLWEDRAGAGPRKRGPASRQKNRAEFFWEGGPLYRDVYPGSLAARTSTFSIDGGCENRSAAFAISAAATRPARWA